MSKSFNRSADGNAVMVTGGAGYVGSILLRELLKSGHRVVCVDNLRFGGDSLVGIWGHPGLVLERVDITNYGELSAVFDRYEIHAIVHLAAIVGDPACKLEPELASQTNLDASVHLLERAIQAKVEKFVFASTCSNYGRMTDEAGYVDESSALAPVSLYAELKVQFETLLMSQPQRDDGICPTVLRFATAYGISPRMRFDLTVNEFAKEIALGRVLRVFGEQFWRPYCYVGDLARAILAVLGANDRSVAFNVFNVGDTSQNYSKKMLVDELFTQVPGANVEYVHKDDDPRDYRVNFEKIRDTLRFRISKTVPEGIRDVLSCVRDGVIRSPQDQKYYNTPV